MEIKNYLKILSPLLFFPIFVFASECPLPAQGNIVLNSCVISSGKRVGVDQGNITIPTSATLQMEENTELVFEPGFYIKVDGYILKPSRSAIIRKGNYVYNPPPPPPTVTLNCSYGPPPYNNYPDIRNYIYFEVNVSGGTTNYTYTWTITRMNQGGKIFTSKCNGETGSQCVMTYSPYLASPFGYPDDSWVGRFKNDDRLWAKVSVNTGSSVIQSNTCGWWFGCYPIVDVSQLYSCAFFTYGLAGCCVPKQNL